MVKSQGKIFEASIEASAKEQNIWFMRIKDVNPMSLKRGAQVPKNKFDCLMYYKDYLFPIEQKSTKGKSFSFSESIIKQFQIDSLKEAVEYDGVIAGFMFNFRSEEARTFFVHIDDFLQYQHIAQNEIKLHSYKSKVNKSSIPIGICEEIGVEINSKLKRTTYRYFLQDLFEVLIERYSK